MKYSGEGYITKKHIGPKALYDYLWDQSAPLATALRLTFDQRAQYHRFIVHVFVSMLSGKGDDRDRKPKSVPIYSRLIEREFGRGFNVEELRNRKVILMSRYNKKQKKAREFRLTDEIFESAFEIYSVIIRKRWRRLVEGSYEAPDTVNLVSGRKWYQTTKSFIRKDPTEYQDFNLPSLIKRSVESLKPFPFNPKYVEKLVSRLEKKKKHIKPDHIKIKDLLPEQLKDYYLARGRLQNCLRAQETILNQLPTKIKERSAKGDPLFEYSARWTVQVSGRITEEHGGFQSASRVFKHLSLTDMKKALGFYNYDLKASQARILMQELKASKIKCPWLKNYNKNPESKTIYANRAELTVDDWKQCFYAVIMGADPNSQESKVYAILKEYVTGKKKLRILMDPPIGSSDKESPFYNEFLGEPSNPDYENEYRSEIDQKQAEQWHAYREYVNKKILWEKSEIEVILARFMSVIRPLVKAAKKWRNHLYADRDPRYTYQHGGLTFWKNSAGLKFKEFGLKYVKGKRVLIDRKTGDICSSPATVKELKRKLTAFILQGAEAAFVHHLTLICADNGIPVYRNEHDGIIVGKIIPQKWINLAAKKSGLNNPGFVEKRICPDEKIQEYSDFTKINR